MSREMKHSGVPWLKDIPSNWNVERGKNVLVLQKRPVRESDDVVTCFRDGEVILRSLRRTEGFTMSDKEIGYQGINEGDIVIHGMDGFAGAMGVSKSTGKGSPVLVVCSPKYDAIPQYIIYYLRALAMTDVFIALATGIRERSCDLRWNKISELEFILPTSAEQQKIASFLDRKCAEIDEMIALQEKIVEELKAYKQSVITEAVTKGLNPDVPMKDSGIEWIGEIPENSSISRIGFCVCGYKAGPFGSALITGNLLTEGKILVYTPEHIAKLTTEIPNNLYLQEERLNEMSQFLVKEGEVIFPIVGSLGRAMRVNSNMPVGIINQRLSKFTIKEDRVNADYFMWLFGKSNFYETYIEMYQRGSFIVNLTKTLVYDMPIVLHPINEQKAIADYLDTKCTEIDNLISIKLSKIDSLKEYKKSIIYEYVTGKKEVTL